MINLLPSDVKINILYAKRNTTLTHLGIFLGGLTAIIVSIYGYQFLVLSSDLKTAQNEFDSKNSLIESSKIEADAQKLSSTISTASTLLKRERKFSILIKQIGSLMPAGAHLSGITLSNDTKQPLQIDAVIATESDSLVLKRNIEEVLDTDGQKIFSGADIQAVSSVRTKEASGDKLTFNVKITTAFKEKTSTTSNTKTETAKPVSSAELIGEKKK